MDGQETEVNLKKLERKHKVNEFTSLFTFYYSGFNIRSSDLNAK